MTNQVKILKTDQFMFIILFRIWNSTEEWWAKCGRDAKKKLPRVQNIQIFLCKIVTLN